MTIGPEPELFVCDIISPSLFLTLKPTSIFKMTRENLEHEGVSQELLVFLQRKNMFHLRVLFHAALSLLAAVCHVYVSSAILQLNPRAHVPSGLLLPPPAPVPAPRFVFGVKLGDKLITFLLRCLVPAGIYSGSSSGSPSSSASIHF